MKYQYNNLKSLLLIVSLFCLVQIGQSQSTLNPAAMREDFQVFKNSISDIHPGLYWYSDSTEVNRRFDKIENAINEDLSLREFYGLLREFYSEINCGHSWMETPLNWKNEFEKGAYTLPINIYFEDSLFTVLHDLTPDKKIPEGATIINFNGQPMQQVFDGLLKYAASDGFNLTRRRAFVARNFSNLYQTYHTPDSIFKVEYALPGSTVLKVATLKGLTKVAHRQIQEERYSKGKTISTPLASYKRLEDNVGYIDLNSFSRGWLKSNKINYKKFLKETFASLKEKGVDKLILDLRGNGGGSDVFGAILCQYLMKEEFEYFDRMEAVTSKFKYKDYSNTKWYNTIGVLFKKDRKKPGFFTFNYHKPLATQKPRKNAFSGELVVLTDGNTFSTSADVASVLHFNERATFIGREVGGGYYGNNSALQYQIVLPNSKVTYYIPVIRYYSAVDNPAFFGHGVKPDMVVKSTYADRIAKKDAAMEEAISFLKKQ